MSVKVKMNSTTHELLEAEDNQLQLLGSTTSTVWQTFTFPNGRTIWDYEYMILSACTNDGYKRTLCTTEIPSINGVSPSQASVSNDDKAYGCVYASEPNVYNCSCAFWNNIYFYLKSKSATYCVAQLWGKLKSGGVLNYLRALIGGIAYEL